MNQDIIRISGTLLRYVNEIETHPTAAIQVYKVVFIIKLDVLCLNSDSCYGKKKYDGLRESVFCQISLD